MYSFKTRKKLKIVKQMKEALSLNLQDEYDCGYYNGIEFVLAQIENREPVYVNPDDIEEKENKEEKEKETKKRTTIKGVRRIGGGE